MISPPTTSTCEPLRWSRRRRGKYQKRSVFSSRRSPSIRGMGQHSAVVRFAVFAWLSTVGAKIRRRTVLHDFPKSCPVLFTRLFAVGPADPPIHAPAAADRAVFAEEILKGRPKIWRERPGRELHSASPWQPRLQSKNPVEFPPGLYELHGRSKCEGQVMGRADHYLIFETAGGFCGIAWNSAGITRFQLPTKSATATERILLRQVPGAKPGAPTPEVVEAVAAVRRYFEGKETDFSMFKLDLGEQDPFFERVYAAARQVGWGRTTTYGALAKELGAGPEAARDVGQAMAKNPVALMIPCHRVLAAGGKVGGFSAPGGSAAKIRMLALEGVHVEPARPAQQSFGF